MWEFIESQEAIEIVTQNASAARGASALLTAATERWAKKGGGYRDDIVVGVIYPPLWA